MKLSDFTIGKPFHYGAGIHMCTDIGTRIVTAVYLEEDMDKDMLKGPPYLLNEIVLDEMDQKKCFTDIATRLKESSESNHPGFSGPAVVVMLQEASGEDHHTYPYQKMYGRARISPKGEFLHPYTARRNNGSWIVYCYDLLKKTHMDIDHKELIRMPLAKDEDYPPSPWNKSKPA